MNTPRLVSVLLLGLGSLAPFTAHAQLLPSGQTVPQTPQDGRPVMVLMRDGSVRPVTTNISPDVLRALQQNQEDGYGIQRDGSNTPIQVRPNPEARNGLGGYMVNTEQGLDAQLGFLRQAEQNWTLANGPLIYSYQAIRITGGENADQLFARLQSFAQFNGSGSTMNVAEARVVTGSVFDPNFRERNFVLFRARPEYPGLVGVLNGLQEFVNPRWVPVEIFSNPTQRNVTAVTLGSHMIVGSRRWTVQPQPDGSIIVETEAWEARNGSLNDVAMRTGAPGLMTGRDIMGMVWDRYLNNIGAAATANGGSFGYVTGVGRGGIWRERPAGTPNPFRPGIPRSGVPGPAVPNGHFGPGYVPPALPALPALPVGAAPVPRNQLLTLTRMNSTIMCHQPQQPQSFNLSLNGFGGTGFQGPRGANTSLTAADRELLQRILSGGPGVGTRRNGQ